VILLRPTIHVNRRLWVVVHVDERGERVLTPPLSREEAVRVAVWFASRNATSPSHTKAG
jgi:hypothetical protein